MRGRVAAWWRRQWGLVFDPDAAGRAETTALVQAGLEAAIAHGEACAWHPERPAVAVVHTLDGAVVAACRVCACLPGSTALPVLAGRHSTRWVVTS